MKVLDWIDEKVKKLTVWDIGILKILCVLAGMILGAYAAGFVLRNINVFIILCALLLCVLWIRIYLTAIKKKNTSCQNGE